jgi:hypothetical protein
MSAFMHSAVSFGMPNMPPPDVGSSIGPIALHNAIVIQPSLAVDLIDVPIGPLEVSPLGTLRMLDRPDEFYAGGLHPGAG